MSDEPDNLVLVFLRRIEERLSNHDAEFHVVGVRLTAIERRLAAWEAKGHERLRH